MKLPTTLKHKPVIVVETIRRDTASPRLRSCYFRMSGARIFPQSISVAQTV